MWNKHRNRVQKGALKMENIMVGIWKSTESPEKEVKIILENRIRKSGRRKIRKLQDQFRRPDSWKTSILERKQKMESKNFEENSSIIYQKTTYFFSWGALHGPGQRCHTKSHHWNFRTIGTENISSKLETEREREPSNRFRNQKCIRSSRRAQTQAILWWLRRKIPPY